MSSLCGPLFPLILKQSHKVAHTNLELTLKTKWSLTLQSSCLSFLHHQASFFSSHIHLHHMKLPKLAIFNYKDVQSTSVWPTTVTQ